MSRNRSRRLWRSVSGCVREQTARELGRWGLLIALAVHAPTAVAGGVSEQGDMWTRGSQFHSPRVRLRTANVVSSAMGFSSTFGGEKSRSKPVWNLVVNALPAVAAEDSTEPGADPAVGGSMPTAFWQAAKARVIEVFARRANKSGKTPIRADQARKILLLVEQYDLWPRAVDPTTAKWDAKSGPDCGTPEHMFSILKDIRLRCSQPLSDGLTLHALRAAAMDVRSLIGQHLQLAERKFAQASEAYARLMEEPAVEHLYKAEASLLQASSGRPRAAREIEDLRAYAGDLETQEADLRGALEGLKKRRDDIHAMNEQATTLFNEVVAIAAAAEQAKSAGPPH